MSAADAVDLLVKTAEATFVSADFVKVALPAWINELVSPTSLAARTARNGLIGAAGGGVLGMMREHGKPEEDRSYLGGAGRGALLGGLVGGAGTLAAGGFEGTKTLTDAEKAELAVAEHDSASQANAAAQLERLRGGTSPVPELPGGGHKLFPALQAVTKPSAGISNVTAVFDPKLYSGLGATPWGTAVGVGIGAGIGAGTGRVAGNWYTGVPMRGPGGDIKPSSFNIVGALRGLARAPNASVHRTGTTLGGGVLGALGGAVLGNGVSALIERFRGG